VTLPTPEKTTQGYLHTPAGELFFSARGDLQAGTPLVCVHGGPGFTSYTLEPLLALSELVPVVCYDQAGCGRARRAGARKVFSRVSFIEELAALQRHLGVERMHLFGHSFGGLVVVEYALAYPERVASLLCASASLDMPRWRADAERLIAPLPLMQRMLLREGLRSGQWGGAAMEAAVAEYYKRYVFGFTEAPPLFQRAVSESDAHTYQLVWGPNELACTSAELREYSIVARLGEIRCPVLFLCGRFDEATPEAHTDFAACIQGSRVHVFEQSAHHFMVTDEAESLRVVRQFLASV
jgi:proline iminopeptidase